jgi:peptide/nickel transport system permease protein
VVDLPTVVGGVIILGLVATAALAPYVAPFPRDVLETHPAQRLQPPSFRHPFGTDSLGRDLLSRVVFGGRITLTVCTVVMGASLLIGVPAGLLAGYAEGPVSGLVMRVGDLFLSIPQVILAMALAYGLGPSLPNMMLALSLTYWPFFARIVAAEVRSLKKAVFVEATEALGVRTAHIVLLHLLPNVSSAIIVRTSLGMGLTILTAATLGFLGLGARPPVPEWGVTIAEARHFLPGAWWYATFPGLAILLVVMGFNLLGDGLRDMLDPRIRRTVR